ncbi:hypothetical protein L4Z68_001400 [Pseudomonas aeruginosa]|nr:hypothetical protein [Pseudomonas aeruginosa]EKX2969407.1 hypothetical protein [Pseudomonas aeruginosa]HBO8004224.1 hypothetical protein [Pseudomonas aeruginosa]HDV6123086.1 hypothetical protein [Pseudomonas aeruginosa]HDV6143964.1 hypothetical protein [Pseudomonas aeruginosa]
MKERPHVVLEDAVAEKTRSSWLYRLRSWTAFPMMVAALCGLIAAMWCYLSGSMNDYGLLLSLVLAAVTYWLACMVVTDNELDPITSSFSLKKIADLAAEHPAVASFVSDAVGKGNTLRVRDLRAAYRIEREADSQKISEYDKQEAEEAAKVRAELAATYGPAAAKEREE